MVLLYASSHRHDSTYHSLCYTSRGQKINIEGKGVTQTGLLAIVYKNTNEYLVILFTPEVESNAVYLSRTEGR